MVRVGQCDDTVIRTVREADADALRDLRLEALRLCPTAFGADLAETGAKPVEWWRDLARRNGGEGYEAILLAVAPTGRFVGMTGVGGSAAPKTAHRAHVWGVYVRPEARGKGLGGRLLGAAIEWAREKRLLLLTLDVNVDNQAAIRCYQRAGFATYGVQPMVIQVDGVFYDELNMFRRP